MHENGCGKGDELIDVVMVEGWVLHLALQSARSLICTPIARRVTTLRVLTCTLCNGVMETSPLRPSSPVDFAKPATIMDLWKAGKHESRREVIDVKEDWRKKREKNEIEKRGSYRVGWKGKSCLKEWRMKFRRGEILIAMLIVQG